MQGRLLGVAGRFGRGIGNRLKGGFPADAIEAVEENFVGVDVNELNLNLVKLVLA